MNILALSAPKTDKSGYTKTYKNLVKTIFQSWNIRKIQKDNSELISDELLNTILLNNNSQEEIFIWGLNINDEDKSKINYKDININDLVLFYGSYDGVYKQGNIVNSFMDNSKNLSNYFWGSSRYNLIIFLKNLKNVGNIDKNFIASNKLFGVSSTKNEKRWGIMQKNKLILWNEQNKINPNLFNVDLILNKLKDNNLVPGNEINHKTIKLINDPVHLKHTEYFNNNLNKISKETHIVRTYDQIKLISDYAKSSGTSGELAVFNYEKEWLLKQNKRDLSEKVEHTALKNENAGYDILSYDLEGNEKYIEVKTTKKKWGAKSLTFYMSEAEKKFLENHERYFIYFIGNIDINNNEEIEFYYLEKKDLKFLRFKPKDYFVNFEYDL